MSTLSALPHLVALVTEGTDNPSADFSDTPLWLSLIKAPSACCRPWPTA